MSVAVKVAIVVGTAGAVYGIAKLRDAAAQAAEAVDSVNAAGEKTAKADGIFAKAVRASRTVRSASLSELSGTILGRRIPLWQRVNGAASLMSGNKEGAAGRAGGRSSADERRENIALALKGMNSMSALAREARGWYKLLFLETNKGPGAGIRALKKVTKEIGDTAKRTLDSYDAIVSMAGGAIAALGGANLLGGAGGTFERAFGLARAKEDARITFDTLLGSRDLTDELLRGITKYSAQTPFQKADIVSASKRLLTVSGKDIKENERLYKIAAQIAALKPGTTVEEVSQGLVSGAFGEFEILKGLTFRLNAEMFKGAGETGGKEYAEAVITELEKQLLEKTGGRDLVLALSSSLTGLVSTIKDSIEEPLTALGETLIEGWGVKELMVGYITQATYFADYFGQIMTGKAAMADPAMASGVKALADLVADGAKGLVWLGKTVIDFGQKLWLLFEGLSPSIQRAVLGVGVFGSAATVALGVIVPLVTGLLTLGSVLWAPFSAIGTALGSVSIKIGVVVGALYAIGAAIAGAGIFSAFMLFRREGEAFTDTLIRLGGYITGWLVQGFENLKLVMVAAWVPVSTALVPAWNRLLAAFAAVRPYFVELAVLLSGSAVEGQTFVDIGTRIGGLLVWLLDVTVGLIEIGMKGLGAIMIWLRPHFKHLASDMKLITKTIFDFLAGAATAQTTMKTLFLGLVDTVTIPFRVIIEHLYTMMATALADAANTVRPFSSMVANGLDEASRKARQAAEDVSQGFLKTREELLSKDSAMMLNVSGSVAAEVPVQLNIDGERVAETQARVGMRARNSGRGGDPMSPEEMGFVINNGRIRTVDMTSVAAQGGA